MAVDAFLRRAVVIGNDGQGVIGADAFGFLRQRDGFAGVIGAGAGDYRNAAGGVFDGGFDHGQMFVHRKRGRFAGGADGDNGVGAVGDMPVY